MVVQNHLLDKKELPGGTLGQYEANGKKYQMFIIETSSSQDAAILLLDLKNTLTMPNTSLIWAGIRARTRASLFIRLPSFNMSPALWGSIKTRQTRLHVNSQPSSVKVSPLITVGLWLDSPFLDRETLGGSAAVGVLGG